MADAALKLIKGDKEVRDKFINRTEVLDKVKELTVLPIGNYVDSKQVCEYFEITQMTLRSVMKKGKEEFEADGVIILRGSELGKYKSDLYTKHNIFLTARASLTMYTKRAVLRMAMMLDRSPIAKEVQNYLLQIEEISTEKQKESAIKAHTNWTEELDNNIIESVRNKLDNGVKITYALKEISEEMEIPHPRLYSRWHTGNTKLSPLKLKLKDTNKKEIVVNNNSENNIEQIIEENNNKLIQKFETLLNKQQEIIVGSLAKVWRKLEETKEQQEIIIDDINMIKFDFAKMTQSVDKNVNDDIQRLEKRSKLLSNKLKNVEGEKDQLLKFIGKQSAMAEALMNEDSMGVKYKTDSKGNVNLL
ncbi:hypothetical protein [Priestia megaterium]|uniref:hypothetical protein n=1 Tax=Priestia megaterium TaxID=1404 RepID=UPI0028780C60|nr:hypothetical protein [Priestia megaterium]